ncbi:MAG TPA: diguanylate cyclase [Acidimicrobiales bacterium]|nr:diguanylate cyclase [Acidimicrobiales bacterium]
MDSPGGRETAGVTTRLIVRYVRAHAGAVAVGDVLRLAGEQRPLSVLEDERSWSTYDQKIALFEAAAKVLDDEDVARHVGEWVLDEQIGLPLRMVLWAMGSPAQLLRNISRACTKFSTVADMACPEAGSTSAVVTYRLHDGYTPSFHDCGYTQGLLSQASALFGVPPARIDHDECQVAGAERCVFELSFPRRKRLFSARRRNRRLETELRLMTNQVESLQRAAAEIVSAPTIDETIGRVASRARTVIRAAGLIVAVQPLAGSEPIVHAEGFDDDERDDLARKLTADPVEDVAGAVVFEIRSPRRIYGRILATSPGGDPFFPEEQRMLTAFGTFAATALDAAVSRETVHVLAELGRSLADITATTDVCDRVAAAVPQVIGAPYAAVALWDAPELVMRFVGVEGFSSDMNAALRAVEVHPDDSPDLLAQIENPRPRFYTRSSPDEFVSALLDGFGVEAAMTAPILVRGELRGQVAAGWNVPPPTAFESELVERMAGLAVQAATALENARLLEAATHQALHDPLTGLPNRMLLDDRLQQAAARARREETLVGVLLVDLDGFKQINDTLGHRAGDEVLCHVATRLRSALRDADTAARFGGDEFVVICQDVREMEEVEAIAARIESAIAERMVLSAGEVVCVGASVGLTVVDGSSYDIDELLGLADDAMYRIKRTRPDRRPVLV